MAESTLREPVVRAGGGRIVAPYVTAWSGEVLARFCRELAREANKLADAVDPATSVGEGDD